MSLKCYFVNIILICPICWGWKILSKWKLGFLHSQPFTNRHIYFLSIVGLVTSQVLLSCPKSLPRLVLCWHSSWICWVNQCNHDHGCIFIHFKTVCTISWFAVLCFQHALLLLVDCAFWWEKHIFLMKKFICELRCWTSFHCYHCTSYPMKTIWPTHSLTDTCRIWCMLPLLQILPVLENKILD
jgi:hypothetical protein